MSYGLGAALQAAVYARLTSLPALSGVPVLDAVPKGQRAGTFVLIGSEEVRDRSDGTGRGALHRFAVSVVSDAAGFLAAKEIAAAISDALGDPPPVLTRGRIARLWFVQARARRLDEGRVRRIDLTFAARVED